MPALICGSIAYDAIMVFEDSFKRYILPEQIHILNVTFLVPELRREFGGCAANIAYNLKLLGEEPIPMCTVGRDFAPYREWLQTQGIRCDHVRVIDDVYTAQAYITTDLDDNQITAFHPGAMNHSHLNRVGDAPEATLGILSPDGRKGMVEHATQFSDAGIPFIFDPGQQLPLFTGEELRRFIEQARWVTVNDYEWQLLKHTTGWDEADITGSRRCTHRDPRRQWLDHPHRRRADRNSRRQTPPDQRSYRLRRRLSCGPAVRAAARLGLGDDGARGESDGRH